MARPSSSQRLQAFHRVHDPFRGSFQAVVGEAGLNEKLADGALVHVEVQQVAEAHALSGNVASVVPVGADVAEGGGEGARVGGGLPREGLGVIGVRLNQPHPSRR